MNNPKVTIEASYLNILGTMILELSDLRAEKGDDLGSIYAHDQFKKIYQICHDAGLYKDLEELEANEHV